MTVSKTKRLAACAAVAVYLIAGPSKSVAQESEDGPRKVTATLPVTTGWFDGEPSFYLSTDASDRAVAAANRANYAPLLANAANTAAVDDIYAVTNFKQGNIIPSAPVPAGPTNANMAYSPLWQLSTVTWNAGATPRLLRSEAEVLAMKSAGKVTVVKTNIVINCSVLYTPQGDVLPGTDILVSRATGAATMVKATLPVTVGWFNGRSVFYISTDASDAGAGGPEANLSKALGNAANGTAVDDIYVVKNFKQGNILPSAPGPTGPTSTSTQYTPIWQVSVVTWKAGKTPRTLKSEAEVLAAKADGAVTISKTNIVVNCPVLYTPQGGKLGGVTFTTSE